MRSQQSESGTKCHMNRQTWVEQSFALVSRGGYLDALGIVYPVSLAEIRSLTDSTKTVISNAMRETDDAKMLRRLLALTGVKFPFNDPFISFLRAAPDEIDTNHFTVSRICARLRSMGESEVIDAMEAPIDPNRRMGHAFSGWLQSKYRFIDDRYTFERSAESLVFYNAGGRQLRELANAKGCGLQKEPDFVAKAKGRFIVGEAKWLGTEGGNQNRGLDDALNLAGRTPRDASTVAVLDGILWIRNSGQMAQRVSNFAGNAMSALLLDDFLKTL